MHGMRMWLVTAEGEAWPVSVSVLVMTASPAKALLYTEN